jgi:hypothetical protein
MIDVSGLVTDPDFARSYKVIRQTGEWNAGRFTVTDLQTLNYFGAVQPANSETLQQVPESDRTNKIIKFYCASPKTFNISREYARLEWSVESMHWFA